MYGFIMQQITTKPNAGMTCQTGSGWTYRIQFLHDLLIVFPIQEQGRRGPNTETGICMPAYWYVYS